MPRPRRWGPGNRALTLLAVAVFAGVCHHVQAEPKLSVLITALQAESQSFVASDMGVQRFAWNISVTNPTYPYSPKQFTARVLLFVRYTYWKETAYIKGFMMADTRDAAKPADGVPLDPVLSLRTLGDSAQSAQHSFTVNCQLHSYWDPRQQAATVYGFEQSIPVASGSAHEYELSMSLDPDTAYLWRPYKSINLMDGRGLEVAPIPQPTTNPRREAYVILKPLYNFNPALYGPLIERHIEYYQALGVAKHVIYLRKESIPQLLYGNQNLWRAAQKGRLVVVEWDMLEEHDVWHRQYDQRVIYSHAMLVFSTLDVYLLNVDLDEYLVTSNAQLQDQSIQDMVQTCAGGAMDVRVARFPVVCKSCDRDKPETMLWSGEASLNHPNHPLSWYHLINTKGGHTRRLSIVNPNFITSYSFTHGTLRQDLEPAYPEPTCMAFLHIPNMVRVREEADLVESDYTEDSSWMGVLKRFKKDAPPATASAAPATAPATGGGRQLLQWLEEQEDMTAADSPTLGLSAYMASA